MAESLLDGVALRGVVSAVPGSPIPIGSLTKDFGMGFAERFSKTTGVSRVYRAGPEQTASDLCQSAAEALMKSIGWVSSSIDGLVMVTQTPDHFFPGNACILHGRLGLRDDCVCFDVSLGCSGYVHGLMIAGNMIASGLCRRIILLAGDTISRAVCQTDQSVAALFSDAGSATALEYDPDAQSWGFVFGTDGAGYDNLILPGRGWREVAGEPGGSTAGGLDLSNRYMQMDGLEIFSFSLKRAPAAVSRVTKLMGWNKDLVDVLLLHQANKAIIDAVRKKIGIELSKVPINIDRYGNASVASIPLLMSDPVSAIGQGGLRNLVLVGFGVGLSWGAAALICNDPVVSIISV